MAQIISVTKQITHYAITGVQIDVNALTMTIFIERRDAAETPVDTRTLIIPAAQFNAAWTGTIQGTIVAICNASTAVTT